MNPNRRLLSIFSIFLVTLFLSCRNSVPLEPVSEEELNSYVVDESNGLIKKIKVDSYEITALYRPKDLLILQELKAGSIDSVRLKQIQNKYSTHCYFIVKISESGKEVLSPKTMEPSRFSDLLQTLSFEMERYLFVTTPNDTIPLSDYSFNRTYEFSNSTDLLIVFEKEKFQNEDWIKIQLKEFGLGTGEQFLQFKTADLLRTPRLNFKLSNSELL